MKLHFPIFYKTLLHKAYYAKYRIDIERVTPFRLHYIGINSYVYFNTF